MTSIRPSAQAQQPRGLAFFRQALKGLGVCELSVAVTAFFLAVILNFIQISLRYAFEKSIWWSQEISLLLMMIAYFLGISCVFRSRQYVIILMIVERLPQKIQLLSYYFAQLLTIFFCTVILVEGIIIAPERLTTYTVILHFPEFFWTLPLLVASASMILTSIYFSVSIWNASLKNPGFSLSKLEASVLVNKEADQK